MSGHVLLYGANGVTGLEVAHHLAGKVDLKLAGRNPEAIRAIAGELGVPWVAFGLDDTKATAQHVGEAGAVLNAAGPFNETAGHLVRACTANGTHYLDLGGEWPVFKQLKTHDREASDANVMILPGIGLTVAATDCLMKRAVELWPDTDRLCLGISRAQVISRGSVSTAARLLDADAMICRDKKLERVPAGSLKRPFDFGSGLSDCVAMSWADVVTGPVSTGVANIEVYTEMKWHERAAYRMSGIGMRVTGERQAREFADQLSMAWPRSPSPEARERARFAMVVEALDKWRRVRRLKLHTLDGYTSSVLCAGEVVRRVLGGEAPAGFQTPASAFGAQLVVDAGAGVFESLTPAETAP